MQIEFLSNSNIGFSFAGSTKFKGVIRLILLRLRVKMGKSIVLMSKSTHCFPSDIEIGKSINFLSNNKQSILSSIK